MTTTPWLIAPVMVKGTKHGKQRNPDRSGKENNSAHDRDVLSRTPSCRKRDLRRLHAPASSCHGKHRQVPVSGGGQAGMRSLPEPMFRPGKTQAIQEGHGLRRAAHGDGSPRSDDAPLPRCLEDGAKEVVQDQKGTGSLEKSSLPLFIFPFPALHHCPVRPILRPSDPKEHRPC